MNKVVVIFTLIGATFSAGTVEAGIFGRRGVQTTNQYRSYPQPAAQPTQPTSGYRSYSQQPTFPFGSRSDPRDWKEAHRGYGIKIRGW